MDFLKQLFNKGLEKKVQLLFVMVYGY